MSSSKLIAWCVWIIASIFYAYQYILRVMPNIMLDDIMQQFHISAAAFGQFSGVYYIGYSLMHLPIGLMLDRYGPKKVIPSCILLTVAGLMPLIFSDYWVYPIFGRLLIGMGSSAAILGVFKVIRMTFKEERFPRMLSLSVTIGLVGAIYGGGPVSYMRDLLGFKSVVELFAGAGLLLACLTYWIIPHYKKSDKRAVMSDIKAVLGNGRLLASCFFAGLMVGPLEGFADVWGSAFLKIGYGLNGTLSASLPSMIFIGMCFGGPLLGLIAEKTGSYLSTILGAGALMAGAFICLLTLSLPPETISFSFILIGICSAYQILAIYKVSTYVKEEAAGLATAVANMIIMIFGYAFHSVMGAVIARFGGAAHPNALFYGVGVIPLALLIGCMGFIYLLAQEKRQISGAPERLKA